MNKRRPQNAESVSDTIRTGEYFNEARRWYFVLFSNPIAERSFYAITAVLAAIALVISVTAVVNILPVSSIFPFYVRNNDTSHKIPRIIKLRTDHTESQDFALMRYFVQQYVTYRERYAQDTFATSAKFVANYSSQPVLESYARMMDVSNPNSPKLLFSDRWMRRVVEVTSVVINQEITPNQALVRFNASVRGTNSHEVIEYVADLQFIYTPLQAQTELDSVTGEKVTRFKNPEFQVVKYNVQQTAAQKPNAGYKSVR
jgi:type IV secretion system protein VirB8